MKKLFEEYSEALIAIVIASIMFIIVFSFGYPMISKASKETTDKAGSSNWSQRTAIILPSIAASDKPVINAKSAYVDYGQKFNIKNYVTAYDSNGNSLNDNISIYTITCITTDDNGKEKKVTQKATKTTPISFDTTKPGNYIVKYQVYTRETALSKYLIYSYAKARYVVSNNTHVPTETLDTERFRKYASENNPTKVVFTTSLANAPNTTVDVSVAQNDSIQAWMDGKTLYVGQSGGVYASRNCTKLFYSDSSTGWQSKITEIDMTGFVSENIITTYQMFKDCVGLKRIYVSSDWDTDKITTSTGMFENDFNLSGYQGTTFSSSKANAERAHVDNGASRPGYFSARQIVVKKTNGSATYTGMATNGEAKVEVTNPSEGATVRYGTSAGTYNYTSVPSYTAVGTYTVYYKVTAPNFEDATGTLTIVIDKGKGTTVSPKALNDLVYNGKAQSLVSAGKSDAGTLLYSLDNKTWSESIPTGTNAGSYTVYYKVANDTNHLPSDVESVSVEIKKANVTITEPNTVNVIYNGTAQKLLTGGSVTNGHFEYSLDNGNTWTTTIPTGINAGDYSIDYKAVGNTNYSDTIVTTVKSIINPNNIQLNEQSASLSYTGKASNGGAKVTVTYPTTGTTVKYGTTEGIYNLTSVPAYTEVGDHIVYYQVTCANYTTRTGLITITINKVGISFTPPTPIDNLSYNTKAQALINAGTTPNGTMQYSLDQTTWSTTIPTGKNAGNYSVYYRIIGDDSYNDSSVYEIIAKINKISPTITLSPTSGILTYPSTKLSFKATASTNEVSLSASGSGGTGVSASMSGDTVNVVWNKDDYENKFIAGESSVIVSSSTTTNYYSTRVFYSLTTKFGTISASTTNGSATYSGSATNGGAKVSVTAPTSGYTIKYGKKSGEYTSSTIPTYTNAGTYTVYYKISAENYNDKTGSFTIKINKATAKVTTAPTAKTLTYNGNAQALLNAGTTSDGTMQYSTDNATWSTSIPTGTSAGTYTVYYRVLGDSNHNNSTSVQLSVKINTKAMTVATTNGSATYSGSSTTGNAKVTVSDPSSGYTIKYGTTSGTYNLTSIPGYINAGTYTIYYQVTATNYTTKTGSFTITVNKANSSVTKAPTTKSLTYNGSAQALVDAGTASGGTMQYSLNNSTWSTNIPTGTNAGSYTVYYKVVGDSNHNNSSTGSVKVTINTKAMAVSVTNGSATYSGSATSGGAKVTVTTPSSGYTVKYGTANGTYNSTTIPTYTNAGTYTIYYQVTATNYTTKTGSLTISIATKAMAISTTNGSATYSGNATNGGAKVTITTPSSGYIIKYGTTSGSYTLTSIPTYTNAGTYTIYYQITATNYTTKTGSLTITIAKANANVTKAPTAKALTYTGSAQALVSAGTASGGTMQYSLNNSTWSTSIPTGTNDGDYTVYYRVLGDSNHNNSSVGSVKVTIEDNKTYTLCEGENFNKLIPSTATSIEFTSEVAPNGATLTDVTEAKDNSVVAWLDGTIWKVSTQKSGKKVIFNENSYNMFANKESLTSISLMNINTTNVTTMNSMFRNCTNLTTLGVSNFDTSKVTDMGFMFYYCSNLTTLDVSNFDTNKVTDMEGMFAGCLNFTTLNVSNFNTSKVTNMNGMFASCPKLTALNVNNFDTSNVISMDSMFSDCTSLTTLDVSNFDTSKVTNMNSMFYYSKLTTLDVSNFDTSKVTIMNSMFYGCSNLTALDVSNFDTSKVTSMDSMFYGCSNLTALNVNNFDTSNVINMNSMFSNCTSLTTLDVSNFDTSKVTDMTSMFYYSKLTTLDVSNFDTSKVTRMNSMFYGCSNLTALDVSNFDTSKVTSMGFMFYYCSNLTTLDVSNFDTNKVTNMGSMFYDCSKLTTIYISELWNILNVTSGNSMFTNNYKIVGQSGTTYDHSKTDVSMANWSNGYLTYKGNNIFLDYCDGSEIKKNSTITKGSQLPTPTRSGYIFNGWYYNLNKVQKFENTKIISDFTNPNSGYFWTKDSNNIWSSGNKGTASSESKMVSEQFTLSESGAISFEWRSNGENSYDYLGYDILNVSTGEYLSGKSSPTYKNCLENLQGKASTSFSTVTKDLDAGTYQLVFMYGKDSSADNNEDQGFVKNVQYGTISTSYEYSNPVGSSDNIAKGTYVYAKWIDNNSIVSKTESQVGKYADIDGDGTVDGIIFADLMVGGSGQWGDSIGKYTIPTVSSAKDYYVSQESYADKLGGTADVLAPIGSGNDRFYIMALSDIDSKTHDWYNAAYGKMNDYASTTSQNFGKGKSNTATMISKWNAEAYGNKNACSDHTDMWGEIQTQVNNGWFVPSRQELAAFAGQLGITKSNFLSKGLFGWYWSSSQYNTNAAYRISLSGGYVGNSAVHNSSYVRLAATF